jgi:hypothetical protein
LAEPNERRPSKVNYRDGRQFRATQVPMTRGE